jgi:D-glucuronyl C5-epimerase C-terminus
MKDERLKNIAKTLVIVIFFSSIIAFPITYLFLNDSVDISQEAYHDLFSIVKIYKIPSKTITDNNGITLVDYGNNQVVENPLVIADSGLQYYSMYRKTGDPVAKEKFFNNIDVLNKTKTDSGKAYIWAYNFPDPSYNITPPWYSALAQSKILLAFEYAYELTGDENYRNIANKTLRSFSTPISDGGVMYPDPNSSGYWYEEVASPQRDKPPFVLNGHLEVLIHLSEYYNLTKDDFAKVLLDKGVSAAEAHLKDYDANYWTYYDREGNWAYDYQYTHVDEMKELYAITGDKIFLDYYEKWSRYLPLNPMWARKRFGAFLFVDGIIIIIACAFLIISKKYGKKGII